MDLVLDAFNGDPFTMASMTDAISDIDYEPGMVGAMGLYESEGVPTRTIIIEKDISTRRLVPTAPWGAPGSTRALNPRNARPFLIPHVPTSAGITAEEIQGVRAYATGMTPQQVLLSVEGLRNKKLGEMKSDLFTTLEFHRIGGLSGKLLDADGTSVIYDLFAEFGVTLQTHQMLLNTTTTNVNGVIRAAIRKAYSAIKGLPVRGWAALCSDSFFDKFVGHSKVEDKYLNWQAAANLAGEHRAYGVFNFGGVDWYNYRGSVVGTGGSAVDFIASGKAKLFPLGVPGLFKEKYGPSDYIDRVNQIPSPDGLPIEVRSEMRPMGKGVDMEAQMNPLCLCTKPDAIVELLENT